MDINIEEHISNYRTEGETGVKNLCKMARLLGYKDNTHFGRFQGGCYGDLINFLEDNPGAVNAIFEFVLENKEIYGRQVY